MKLLFAVRDVVANAYGSLHAEAHEAVAIRNFVTACLEPQNMFFKFPKDYELVCLGFFHDGGEDVPVVGQEPRVVITAQAAISSAQPGGQLELMKEA